MVGLNGADDRLLYHQRLPLDGEDFKIGAHPSLSRVSLQYRSVCFVYFTSNARVVRRDVC